MSRLPVFVYGTLRPDCHNDRVWQGRGVARHDGQCFVVGFKLLSNGGFPYMVPATTSQTVGALIVPEAERYEEVLGMMDQLEGYRPGSAHNHYERIEVPVLTPEGIALAWTYVPDWSHPDLPEVPTNDEGFHDWRLATRRRFTTTERN